MNNKIKWSQWDRDAGLIRCGWMEYRELLRTISELGADAARCLQQQGKRHAVYARKIYQDNGQLDEVRLYCNLYLNDSELDKIARDHPRDVFYTAHARP